MKKHLQKYLFEEKVCNLVTEISSKETGGIPESNTNVILKRKIIEQTEEDFSYQPILRKEENAYRFFEPIAKEERLIVLGGGHISGYLCEFAAKTGFDVWVVDVREEFSNRERFPHAKKVICGKFTDVLPTLNINKNDYVAIVTRGHSCDADVERFALRTPASYIGVVGSKRKTQYVREKLLAEGFTNEEDCLYYILTHELPGYLGMIGSKRRVSAQFKMFREMGVPEEKIAQVHNPIGLPINGVTPPEIAISILAELILEKRTKKTDGTVQTELDYEVLLEWLNGTRPCAMATILKAQGSSPRKEGAKMLIFEDKEASWNYD